MINDRDVSISKTRDRACIFLSLQEQLGSIIEADLLSFLEKGAAMENHLLRQVQEVLPSNMASQIPLPAVPANLPAREGHTMQGYNVAVRMDTQPQNLSVSSSTPSASEAGAMPSSDSRSAAAIVELHIAVSDVRVRITNLSHLVLVLASYCTRLSLPGYGLVANDGRVVVASLQMPMHPGWI